MKTARIILIAVIILCTFAGGFAHAGVMGKVKALISAEVIALAASAVLTVLGGVIGLTFIKTANTFKEFGEFMTVLGVAMEDKRITREELADIIKEGREVFSAWS